MRKRDGSHIAVLLPDFAGGGAQRVMLAVAAAAADDGRSVDLVVMSGRGPLRDSVADGVRLSILGQSRLRNALPSLRAVLRRIQPGAVISAINYLNLGAAISMIGWRDAPPLILREANMPSAIFGTGLSDRVRLQASRYLYKRAAAVLSPSVMVADEMATAFRMPRSEIQVIFNPVDEQFIRRQATEAVDQGPSPSDGPRTFVAAGRLTRQKGFDRLLDDLAELDSRGDRQWRLMVLGEGEDRGALEGKARDLGLSDRVVFEGFVNIPWARIALADAFLLPSRWEGMPNAALEALAVGTPVIATPEAGGIGEIAGEAHKEGNSDAVILARSGPNFVAAMAAVASNRKSSARAVAPSLLPGPFQRDRVMARYLALFDQVTGSSGANS